MKGFKVGFRILTVGEHKTFFVQNLKSVYGMEGMKEVKEGRVLGPFAMVFGDLEGLAFGNSSKKAQGEFRLIFHLSYPEGVSVNNSIPQELCTVSPPLMRWYAW